MAKIKKDDRYQGATIKCLKCGTLNPPDRVFCTNCGAKLPLTENPFDSAPRRRSIKPIIKTVTHLLAIAIIIAIAMIFWPTGRIGMDGNSRNLENFEKKTEALIKAIDEGRGYSAVVNETEINAFLQQRIDEYLEQHRFDSGSVLQDVRMMIKPDYVMVRVKAKHGPLTLVRTVRGVPKIEDNQFLFEIDKVSVGVLPLPAVWADTVSERVAGVFAGAKPALKIVENLNEIELSETKMKLTVD